MSSEFFQIKPFTTSDKVITIQGPCDLRIRIDYDDVSHATVKAATEQFVRSLNSVWTEQLTETCTIPLSYDEEDDRTQNY